MIEQNNNTKKSLEENTEWVHWEYIETNVVTL